MSRFPSTTLSRDEFLDWIGGGGAGAADDRRRAASPSDAERPVALLWDERDGKHRGRPLLAIPTRDIEEFFAFTATYIATYRPLTAFFHVVPLELAEFVTGRRALSEEIIEPFSRLVAGAALAERSVRARTRADDLSRLPLVAVKMTLSAALGTAALAGYAANATAWLADGWEMLALRSGTLPSDQAATMEIAAIWSLLYGVARGDDNGGSYFDNETGRTVAKFLQAALRDGITVDGLEGLGGLGADPVKGIELAQTLAAPREDRIVAFNRFVARMGTGRSDGLEEPFLAGLLLAIAGNGSFDMLRSARELANSSPAAILWFGICAALFADSNVLTASNCLGRRFVRDAQPARGQLGSPRSDLNVFEYRAMASDPVALQQVMSVSTEALCVELLPEVMTFVPRSSRDPDDRQSDEYRLLYQSFQDIRQLVDRTQRRLIRSTSPQQRELFTGDTKSRSRHR